MHNENDHLFRETQTLEADHNFISGLRLENCLLHRADLAGKNFQKPRDETLRNWPPNLQPGVITSWVSTAGYTE